MTEPLIRPPAPKKRRRRQRTSLYLSAVVIALGLMAALGGWWWAGRTASPAQADPQDAGEPFSLQGYATLGLGKFIWTKDPDVCTGSKAYQDLKLGTPVIVTDENGTTIATGTLGFGEPQRDPNNSSRATECRMPIHAIGVPADRPFYRLKIGERGQWEYNRFDIRQPLTITID